jgi:hypothetical protein
MRDRQPTGNIAQQEVIDATCSSAQVPTIAIVANGPAPEPVVINSANYYPAPSPSFNSIPQQPIPSGKIDKYFVSKII